MLLSRHTLCRELIGRDLFLGAVAQFLNDS
jgi:hypothetical protein